MMISVMNEIEKESINIQQVDACEPTGIKYVIEKFDMAKFIDENKDRQDVSLSLQTVTDEDVVLLTNALNNNTVRALINKL